MITARIESGNLRNQLQALRNLSEKPRSIVQAGTAAMRVELQRHFAARDLVPNKLGGRRTNFWGDVRNSTQITEVTDRFGIITIGDLRFAQKLFGGTIRPGSGKMYLSIPVDPEAHGRTAETFERETGLQLFFVRQRQSLLLATIGGTSMQVRYILTPEVHQDPDPQALPPQDRLDAAALEASEGQVRSEIQAIQNQ
jgi:hypothetical protein